MRCGSVARWRLFVFAVASLCIADDLRGMLPSAQVWDNVRMNNIAQHFATAWFGAKLSACDEERERFRTFLATSFSSRDSEREREVEWLGFPDRIHPGLTLRKRAAGE